MCTSIFYMYNIKIIFVDTFDIRSQVHIKIMTFCSYHCDTFDVLVEIYISFSLSLFFTWNGFTRIPWLDIIFISWPNFPRFRYKASSNIFFNPKRSCVLKSLGMPTVFPFQKTIGSIWSSIGSWAHSIKALLFHFYL